MSALRSRYRADKDAIDRFRQGYQTRMNAVLRAYKEAYQGQKTWRFTLNLSGFPWV
jgi:hypothetical protein